MQNTELAEDYLKRARVRAQVLDAFLKAQSWADAVRESQEAVELALKGLLRKAGVEAPRVHDVSDAMRQNRKLLAQLSDQELERMAAVSKHLRRDRELAFYGSEDLTPSQFYSKEDAEEAVRMAREVVEMAVSLGQRPRRR